VGQAVSSHLQKQGIATGPRRLAGFVGKIPAARGLGKRVEIAWAAVQR
jgi:hypothetical protein